MSVFLELSALAVRQVVGAAATASKLPGGDLAAAAIADRLKRHFTDHSRQLTAALAKSNERAWKALEFTLAGDSLWERGKGLLASPDERAFRQQAETFLKTVAAPHLPPGPDFRPACLKELRDARKAGVLSNGQLDPADLSRRVGVFAGLIDGPAVLDAEWRILDRVADQFPANRYPNLQRLLKLRAADGPPLLAVAARYFFRIEVQADDALFRGLSFDTLGSIEQSQQQGFNALQELMTRHGSVLEQLLDVPAAILDLRDEQHRQGGRLDALYDAVIGQKAKLDQPATRLRAGDTLSIRTDAERQLVRSLLGRFRALPPEQQRQSPALLNSLGMLEAAAAQSPDDPGLANARRIFQEVAAAVPDAVAKAEAHHNDYRTALEQRNWPEALAALRRCVEAAPELFAPFPFDRYEPLAILGAGAFGTAFLCLHPRLKTRLVVKSLNRSELQREVDELFREAQDLEELNHPGIIRVRDADYADAARTRPYLVMDYFDGVDLEQHVLRHGPLPVEAGLDFARQLAEAVAAAHAKGLLHRDLKPSNVLVKVEGASVRVKLIDFGLALRSSTLQGLSGSASSANALIGSSVAGSLEYAAPEQMGRMPGVSVGPYSDVYGWARTCCWALFADPHPLPSQFRPLPAALADLLEACLVKDPKKRLADFTKVLARLRDIDGKVEAPSPASGLVRRPAAVPSPPPRPAPSRDFTNSVGMKLIRIDPGEFLMGSPSSEAERQENETQHPVKITRPFMMGVHPVTLGQFAAFVKESGYKTDAEKEGWAYAWNGGKWDKVKGASWRKPGFDQDDTHPVTEVSWNDASTFAQWLGKKEGKTYRLSTEAQWEYACRAGTTTPFHTGETISTDQANYDGNHIYGAGRKGVYRQKTTPVNTFKPNAWGLSDMHGNVWEWCADAYAEYPGDLATDPTGPIAPPQNASRVLRGGSWNGRPRYCRSAFRSRVAPGRRSGIIGFRVVLDSH